ncbi:MAG: hypothetical protein ABIH46_11225 [Chloroflexota bacterium]
MATPYQRGRSAEYRARRCFEELGWLVIRSAGSKGPADICALSQDGMVKLIQVKRGKAGLGTEERAALELLAAAYPYCTVECWHWRGGQWEITRFGEVRCQKAT